jgi:hypothetical protein
MHGLICLYWVFSYVCTYETGVKWSGSHSTSFAKFETRWDCVKIIEDINLSVIHTYMHTYYSRFIPEGVAVASPKYRDALILQKLFTYE